ncbi:hypothetical protein F0726_01599 [Acidithiobacillus caldus]|nr:hypothetical protein F0726_01599 [Acidithiobacillus caldus]
MKSLIAVAALLTVSSVAYADITTSPTMPYGGPIGQDQKQVSLS